MRKLFQKMLALLLALVLCLGAAAPVWAAETAAAAATVQLSRTEGTVTVTNSGGKALTQLADMRLYSGNRVATEAESYAWLMLDSTKLNKLDAVSEAELRKSGKRLEVLLNKGNLYFNVTKPLEDQETLNIRTSTMVVGIRGTCGWVEVVDPRNTLVYVLEGTVWCTVTDPISGQSKTTALSGGETARLTVYDQSRDGDKCGILRDTYTEADINGFVLAELVGDGPMCEKIYEDSGLDLRDLAEEDVRERLERDQAETAEDLREQEELAAGQDQNISREPVWTKPDDPGESPRDTGSEPTSGGGESPAPSGIVRLTMPVTDMEVQQALNLPSTRQVIVSPGADPARNTLDIGINMDVAAGKTLTLESGVPAEVRGGLNVDGTADLRDRLENVAGTVTVNSANTLRVGGQFINRGTLNISATGRVVPVGGIQNSGEFTTSGRVEGSVVVSGGTLRLTGGEIVAAGPAVTAVGGTLSLNGGTITTTASGPALSWNTGVTLTGTGVDIRGVEEGLLEHNGEVYLPEGLGEEFRDDNFFHLNIEEILEPEPDPPSPPVDPDPEPITVELGDFKVTSTGTEYTYADNVLTITGPTPVTIAMKDGVTQTTTDSILVADGVDADITLDNVYIERGEYCALEIEDNSSGNVIITLADGSNNTLISDFQSAGLQKNGGQDSGTLTIQGNGTLTAQGGNGPPMFDHSPGGAGIGSSGDNECANIVILNGTITAEGGSSMFCGAGIGGGGVGNASNIHITGGNITATSDGGAGIGGGEYGTGSDIHISGGTITATGGVGGGAGIGGGNNGASGNIRISDGIITATGGADGGAGIGGGSGAACGDIIISGGTVTAAGADGSGGAGIGSGRDSSSFGTITILDNAIVRVKSSGWQYSGVSYQSAFIGGGLLMTGGETLDDGVPYLATDNWNCILYRTDLSGATEIRVTGKVTITEPLEIGDIENEAFGVGFFPEEYLRGRMPNLLTRDGVPINLEEEVGKTILTRTSAAGSGVSGVYTYNEEDGYYYLYYLGLGA